MAKEWVPSFAPPDAYPATSSVVQMAPPPYSAPRPRVDVIVDRQLMEEAGIIPCPARTGGEDFEDFESDPEAYDAAAALDEMDEDEEAWIADQILQDQAAQIAREEGLLPLHEE